MRKILTLCIIHQPPRVLLGMKKIKFGKGFWNGFGGHVEDGETIEEAACREVKEEAGITVSEIEKMGVLNFTYEGETGEKKEMEVHVFHTQKFTGEPSESDEMAPRWFHEDKIPYETMWPDDSYWLPVLLRGEKFLGIFTFDKHGIMKVQEFKIVEKFS